MYRGPDTNLYISWTILGAPIPDTISQNLDIGGDDEVVKDTPVNEKYNELIHGGIQGKAQKNILSMAFLKKYIHYAKSRIKPVLTQGAADKIANEYTDIRNKALEDSQKVRRASILDSFTNLITFHMSLHANSEGFFSI